MYVFMYIRWINPGYKWTTDPFSPAPYTLPSKMIIAMLVGVNEAGHTRRRTLITSGSDSKTASHSIPTHSRHTTRPVSEKSHGLKKRAAAVVSSKSPVTSSVIGYKVNPSEQLMTVRTPYTQQTKPDTTQMHTNFRTSKCIYNLFFYLALACVRAGSLCPVL